MNKNKILASTIINYSLNVKERENVLINVDSNKPLPLLKELIKEIESKKANVEVRIIDKELEALINEKTTETKARLLEKQYKFDVENFQNFIYIRCNENDYSDHLVSAETRKLIGKRIEKYKNIKVNERKWVLLDYPSNLDAYKNKMTYDEYMEFYYNVMCYDYKKMEKDIKPLKMLMETTDKVRITGVDTDISFSIKDMNIIPCVGTMNLPDGEIYCAPVKNSVNGVIKYNTPSPYQGNIYYGVTLTFKNGKIVEATCDNKDDEKRLNDIFSTDKGAKYVGEFSLGLNPKILNPMGNILFDEKIIGSIHFTPGAAYKDSYNGNDSAVHWDMVLIQRPEYGGGNIYFDDVLIRKDGKFILPELKNLNK